MKYILLNEEMELVIKEVEVLKELEEDDKSVVWVPSKEEYQRAKLVDNDSIYDSKQDAIKAVVDMFDQRLEEFKEEKAEWEDKLN